MGKRGWGQLQQELEEAVNGAQQHNPGVEKKKRKWWLGNKALCKTNASSQVVLGCTGCLPEVQHYRLLTLDAVRDDVAKLQCWFCEGKASSKRLQPEDTMLVQLKKCGIDQEFAPQVKYTWWRGLVDFCHIPSRMAIQVDGSAHFTKHRGVGVPERCQLDLRCCFASWEAGAKLLRVHAADLAGCCSLLRGLTGQAVQIPQPAIAAAQAQGAAASTTTLQQYSKFIVLSAGFAAVRWRVPGDGQRAPYKFVSYTEELLAGLGEGAVEIPLLDGARGYVLLKEKQKQEPSRVLPGN